MLFKNILKITVPILFLAISTIAAQERPDTLKKQQYSPVQEFWNQLDGIFNDPNFSNATWGVIIQSLENGEYLYKRNENKLFIPASDLKIITTASGLILLGPDYKFKTNVLMNGKMDGSTLDGDLIIQGRGDPTISGRFYNGDKFKVYNDWADSLSNYGMDEIDGNLIGDDNAFDDLGMGKGWAWNSASYWYSAPSGAVSFNDNVVDIIVKATQKYNYASLSTVPNTNYVVTTNNVMTVPADSSTSIDVYRQSGTNLVNVFGTIREGDSTKTYATISNPTQYSMVVLKKILEKNNIAVKGFPMDIDFVQKKLDEQKFRKLFTYYSPTLKEIIKVINKNSENFYSEQLLKTIGLEEEGFGSADNGVKAEKSVLQRMGILPDKINIVDGSGLSRLNLVSPTQILKVLTYMFRNKYFVPFYNSLPIAGVDGTLGLRMKGTPAEGNLRAKTGTHFGVSSISGYVYTADNEPVAFSIIVNNYTIPEEIAENIEDLVCLRLANFKRK
jgi:serine-type D-Ala-D-Ala carboxypeptidase/endopeptidase (penicillin-binding protein 4)